MAEFERLKAESLQAVQLRVAQVEAKDSAIDNALVRVFTSDLFRIFSDPFSFSSSFTVIFQVLLELSHWELYRRLIEFKNSRKAVDFLLVKNSKPIWKLLWGNLSQDSVIPFCELLEAHNVPLLSLLTEMPERTSYHLSSFATVRYFGERLGYDLLVPSTQYFRLTLAKERFHLTHGIDLSIMRSSDINKRFPETRLQLIQFGCSLFVDSVSALVSLALDFSEYRLSGLLADHSGIRDLVVSFMFSERQLTRCKSDLQSDLAVRMRTSASHGTLAAPSSERKTISSDSSASSSALSRCKNFFRSAFGSLMSFSSLIVFFLSLQCLSTA
jgi:hypothetical protein